MADQMPLRRIAAELVDLVLELGNAVFAAVTKPRAGRCADGIRAMAFRHGDDPDGVLTASALTGAPNPFLHRGEAFLQPLVVHRQFTAILASAVALGHRDTENATQLRQVDV